TACGSGRGFGGAYGFHGRGDVIHALHLGGGGRHLLGFRNGAGMGAIRTGLALPAGSSFPATAFSAATGAPVASVTGRAGLSAFVDFVFVVFVFTAREFHFFGHVFFHQPFDRDLGAQEFFHADLVVGVFGRADGNGDTVAASAGRAADPVH